MSYRQKKKNFNCILAVLLAVIVIAVAVLFAVQISGENQGYRTISVIEVSGRVGVVKDGIEYSAYPGMLLQEGHEIVTMGDGTVRLVLDGNKYIKVEAGSKLVFETLGMLGSGKTKLCLERGAITNELVAPLGEEEEFVVNTPNAVLAVRGTYFRVELYRTQKGELMADVMTYGGQVATNRVLPQGELVEEDVLVDAGFKARINMNAEETVYVVDEADVPTAEPGVSAEQVVTVPIKTEDIPDEDLVDIYYAAENGHDLFMTSAEAKEDIDARDIDMEEQTSVYEKAEAVKAEQERAAAESSQEKNTTDVAVVANDNRPLSRVEEQDDDAGNMESAVGATATAAPVIGYIGDGVEVVATAAPMVEPTAEPTVAPTAEPTATPTVAPTEEPTAEPTVTPTAEPTAEPTVAPTVAPTAEPTATPTAAPTAEPTVAPTATPTVAPTAEPTATPTVAPTVAPTAEPTATPTAAPTAEPTATPTVAPTATPTATPTVAPTEPTATPTAAPTAEPHTHTPEFAGESGVHSKCAECGEVLETTHSYTERQTTSPTCTTVGKMTYTCDCGYKYTEEIAVLGHDYAEDFTVDTEATCTTAGSKSKHCSRCESKSEMTEIPITDHTEEYGGVAAIHTRCSVCGTITNSSHEMDAGVTTEAGCTTVGVMTHSCACGYSYTEEIAALSHDYASEFTIDTPATCTTAGSKSKHCSRCESIDEVTEIPAPGHTEEDSGEAGVHTKCSVCGETISTAHSYADNITTEATCTTAGVMTHSCACGYSYTEEIAALDHDYASEFTIDTEAGCTTVGSKSKHCSRCESTDEVTEIPATGHTEVDGGEAGVHIKCSACGETISTTHSYADTVTTEAGCTTAGARLRSCDCGYSYTETIPKTGHDPVYGGTAEAHYVCDVCGVITNTSHDFTEDTDAYVAAACETAGKRVYTCPCNYVYEETIAATGHNYLTEKEDPTDDANGRRYECCTRCNDVINEEVLIGFTALNFPDQALRYMASTFDKDYNYALSPDEIAAVTAIYINYSGCTDLTGLELFTSLETLNICEYDLTSLVLPELPSLTTLDIRWSSSTTSLDLSKLTNLQTLYISGSGITSMNNIIWPTGENKISVFDMSDTNMSDIDLSPLTALTELYAKRANLDDTDIAGMLPKITNPANVVTLDLGENSGITSLALTNFTGLRELGLEGNTGITSMVDLSKCTMLSALLISGTGITDFSMTSLANNTNLAVLSLSGLNITSLDLTDHPGMLTLDVSNCTSLATLNVSACTWMTGLNCQNTAITALDVSALTQLESLNISQTNISDFSTMGLESLTRLMTFSAENANLDNSDWTTITGKLTTLLGDLYLADNADITTLDLSKYMGLCRLDLSGLSGLLSLDVSVFTSLNYLDVSNTGISQLILTANGYLSELHVAGLTGLTSLNLSNQTNLMILNTDDCTSITDLGLSQCTALQKLFISGCTGLTSLDLASNTMLMELDVSGCTGLATLDLTNNTMLYQILTGGRHGSGELTITGLSNEDAIED